MRCTGGDAIMVRVLSASSHSSHSATTLQASDRGQWDMKTTMMSNLETSRQSCPRAFHVGKVLPISIAHIGKPVSRKRMRMRAACSRLNSWVMVITSCSLMSPRDMASQLRLERYRQKEHETSQAPVAGRRRIMPTGSKCRSWTTNLRMRA
jgi:hypothetical protein